MMRVLAFALHADPALEFGRGISSEDEPDLWLKDATGAIRLWIDVGLPDERRLRRAAGRAERLVVIAYGGRGIDVWWDRIREALARLPALTVLAIPIEAGRALAALADTLDAPAVHGAGAAGLPERRRALGADRARGAARAIAGVPHVRTRARRAPSRPALRDHGRLRRNPELRPARGPRQPARAAAAPPWPAAARSLRDLHGEQRALHRGLRGRRARGPVLHLHRLAPECRGARLHRERQPRARADHLARAARGRARRARRVPAPRTAADGGCRPGRRAVRRLRERDRRHAGDTDRG